MLKRNDEALLEILGNRSPDKKLSGDDLFAAGFSGDVKQHTTFRLAGERGALPFVLIPADNDAEDFFASVATYYPQHSPITSQIHVVDAGFSRVVSEYKEGRRPYSKIEMNQYFRIGIGAAIGEAVLAGLSSRDSDFLPAYSACGRTLSMSLTRSFFLFGNEVSVKEISGRWALLREMTGLDSSEEVLTTLQAVHSLRSVSALEGSFHESALMSGLKQFVESDGSAEEHLTGTLETMYDGVREALGRMRGPFDGRMAAFTDAIRIIQSHSQGVKVDEIAAAYVCNAILPGSFAHAGLLARLVDFFPAALVWYGMFSVTSKPSQTQQLPNRLLTKLERDLRVPFTFEQRPQCDLSLDELIVLSRVGLRHESIMPSQQRMMLVSLVPGVNVHARFGGADTEAFPGRSRLSSEVAAAQSHATALLEEALLLLRKVDPLQREADAPGNYRRVKKGRLS